MMISTKKLRISMMKWIYTILIKESVYGLKICCSSNMFLVLLESYLRKKTHSDCICLHFENQFHLALKLSVYARSKLKTKTSRY